MKAILGAIALIAVTLGFITGYTYHQTMQKESWHQVTSFVLATSDSALLEDFEIAYSYPDAYQTNGPNFTIKADFWRVKLQTLPYINHTVSSGSYVVYYSDAPLNNIRIWKDRAYYYNPFCSITLFDPRSYNYSFTDAIYEDVRGLRFYYAAAGNHKYAAVESVYTYNGMGDYSITLAEVAMGCFNLTIEEYY